MGSIKKNLKVKKKMRDNYKILLVLAFPKRDVPFFVLSILNHGYEEFHLYFKNVALFNKIQL